MALNKTIKYVLSQYKRSILIYYASVLAVYILLGFSLFRLAAGSQSRVSFGGMEMSSVIFLFVLGLNMFKEPFKMFQQNGRSRRTTFVTLTICAVLAGAVIAALDTAAAVLLSRIITYKSMFEQLYGGARNVALNGFVWSFVFNSVVAMIGTLISSLYYRMNKGLKITVSIGVPAFLFVILPLVSTHLNLGIMRAIGRFFLLVFGLLNGSNPYAFVGFGTLFFALFAACLYLAMRRAPARD